MNLNSATGRPSTTARDQESFLVIFDIDGTLLQTQEVDAACFVGALSDVIGATDVSSDWSQYALSTDFGIANEIALNQRGSALTTAEARAIEARFAELLSRAAIDNPMSFQQVPVTSNALRMFRADPRWHVAIGTGCWKSAALAKTEAADLDIWRFPSATCSDHRNRREILKAAHARALAAGGREAFDHVVYVGDGSWDVRAAQACGFSFVGIFGAAGARHLWGAATVLRQDGSPEDLVEAVDRLAERDDASIGFTPSANDGPFEVRPATKQDSEEIFRCLAQSFAPFRRDYTGAAYAHTVLERSELNRRIALHKVYIARDGLGRIAGTACVAVQPSTRAEIMGFAVAPSFQGSGVAQTLLRRVELEAQEYGCRVVTLGTTPVLKRAMRFYHRCGYQQLTSNRDFHGMPLHVFQKQLKDQGGRSITPLGVHDA